LRGLYSFIENFGGSNGHLLRKALYGNQGIRTAKGQWIELTTAKFSHDSTGRADRLDRFMGRRRQFFLSHGGFVPGLPSLESLFAAARPAGSICPRSSSGCYPLTGGAHSAAIRSRGLDESLASSVFGRGRVRRGWPHSPK